MLATAGAYVAVIGITSQREARTAWMNQDSSGGEREARDNLPARPGAVVGWVLFPRLGESRFVFTGLSALHRGPAWMLESAIPGQPGNSIIAGHRDTHFRFLKDVQKGDRILLESGGSFHRYTVKSIHITSPSDVSLLGQVPGSALTLVTCYPFYYLGSAPKRFIVRAEADPDNY
jgi:sortase A